MELTLLFTELSTRGLSLRRWGDEFEVTGDTGKITDELKTGLVEHRSELEALLPDQKAKQSKALADLTEWLKKAMPQSYRIAVDSEFWREYDKELDAAVESRSLSELDAVIQKLKLRAVDHFQPFHPLPKPGENIIHNPGHTAAAFRWDEEERTAMAWEATMTDAEGERRFVEAMNSFAHHDEADCTSEKVWIHVDGRLMCKRCAPPNDLSEIQSWSNF